MFVTAGRRIDVERIAARVADGPTLVFLHEGLGSIALWRGFPAALAKRTGLGALLYSRYGNGFSEVLREPRDPSYMHDEARITLPALLAQAQIERAILVGHSDGASIALIAAAANPGGIEGVIAEAPHVFVEDVSVRSIAQIGERYRSGDLRERMSRHHSDIDATFLGWHDVWLLPAFRSWNIQSELARVGVPILCIQGRDDPYGTTAQIDSIATGVRSPVDQAILAGCRHAPHNDRPEIVLSICAAWISGLGERAL